MFLSDTSVCVSFCFTEDFLVAGEGKKEEEEVRWVVWCLLEVQLGGLNPWRTQRSLLAPRFLRLPRPGSGVF